MIFNLMDRKVDNRLEKTAHIQTDVKGVNFNTTVTIYQDGTVRLYSQTRNRNALSKRTVSINVTIMNGNKIVYGISSSEVKLYGTLASSVVPRRRSSAVLTAYGQFSLDSIVERGTRDYDRAPHVREIDAQISQIAKDIRKARILSDVANLDVLVQKLQSLKQQRQNDISTLQTQSKLDSITIDVNHVV